MNTTSTESIFASDRQQNTRKVYVLLTRFPDNGSKTIGFYTNFYYTHASIGLDEDMDTFYSFVKKGFFVEKSQNIFRTTMILFRAVFTS